MAVSGDLTAPGEAARLVQAAIDAFSRVDIVFANAGIYLAGPVAEGDPEAWSQLVDTNVTAVFRLVHAALGPMKAQHSGDVVVTSSISGHQAIQWEPVYSASKHAVQAFVHGVRRQVAGYGVRVASLAPGRVVNELWGINSEAEIEAEVAAGHGSSVGGRSRGARVHGHPAPARYRSRPRHVAALPGYMNAGQKTGRINPRYERKRTSCVQLSAMGRAIID